MVSVALFSFKLASGVRDHLALSRVGHSPPPRGPPGHHRGLQRRQRDEASGAREHLQGAAELPAPAAHAVPGDSDVARDKDQDQGGAEGAFTSAQLSATSVMIRYITPLY